MGTGPVKKNDSITVRLKKTINEYWWMIAITGGIIVMFLGDIIDLLVPIPIIKELIALILLSWGLYGIVLSTAASAIKKEEDRLLEKKVAVDNLMTSINEITAKIASSAIVISLTDAQKKYQKSELWQVLRAVNERIWTDYHKYGLLPPEGITREFTIGSLDKTLVKTGSDSNNENPTIWFPCQLALVENVEKVEAWTGVHFSETKTIHISYSEMEIEKIFKKFVPTIVMCSAALAGKLSKLNIPSLYLYFPVSRIEPNRIISIHPDQIDLSKSRTEILNKINEVSKVENTTTSTGSKISWKPCVFECELLISATLKDNVIDESHRIMDNILVEYRETHEFVDLSKHYKDYFKRTIGNDCPEEVTEEIFKKWIKHHVINMEVSPSGSTEILSILIPKLEKISEIMKILNEELKKYPPDPNKELVFTFKMNLTYPISVSSGWHSFPTDFIVTTNVKKISFTIEKVGKLDRNYMAFVSSLCRHELDVAPDKTSNNDESSDHTNTAIITPKSNKPYLTFLPTDSVTFFWTADIEKIKKFWS